MSFESKDEQIFGRQLAAQTVHVNADLTAGTSDLPSRVTIDNSTLTATKITLDVTVAVAKCFKASVINRATGAIVALAAAPDISVANKISVTVNGTAISSCDVELVYQVAK